MSAYVDYLKQILNGQELLSVRFEKIVEKKKVGIVKVKITVEEIELKRFILGVSSLEMRPGIIKAKIDVQNLVVQCKVNARGGPINKKFRLELEVKNLIIESEVRKQNDKWQVSRNLLKVGKIMITTKNHGLTKQLFHAVKEMLSLNSQFHHLLTVTIKGKLEELIRRYLPQLQN